MLPVTTACSRALVQKGNEGTPKRRQVSKGSQTLYQTFGDARQSTLLG